MFVRRLMADTDLPVAVTWLSFVSWHVVSIVLMSWQGQQHRTSGWVKNYNHIRPHEALKQAVPASRYRTSSRRLPRCQPRLSYPTKWQQRQVRSNGEIRWRGRKRFIGEAFVRQRIGLKPLKTGVQAVYFGPLLIGHLHDDDPGAMRPAVYQRRIATGPKPKL